jgi:hypothetical protein
MLYCGDDVALTSNLGHMITTSMSQNTEGTLASQEFNALDPLQVFFNYPFQSDEAYQVHTLKFSLFILFEPHSESCFTSKASVVSLRAVC